ncbi:hypothetical protein EDD29_3255 [Actinocorallia herbida]|uniref:CAAX prenyl protease-like protein n=2 Tax=Actinocorallia herbida TaxID=58109 RepID=A0A3N1CWP1_9ACTN|nr:hypothetical protein EDD29_3255 [Actinocorallia herbida]
MLGFTMGCSLMPFGLGGATVVVLLLEWLAPDVIPFTLTAFWTLPPDETAAFGDAVVSAWPVLLAGLVSSLLRMPGAIAIRRNMPNLPPNAVVHVLSPGRILVTSTLEEVFNRWLLFYAAIAGAAFADFLVLGFAGAHPVRWLFEDVLIPVADWATWHQAHDILTGYSWTVGAALLSSNARFRNGHAYQGWFGWIWSWYFGVALFVITFDHGLPVAIAVHVAYNLVLVAAHLLIVRAHPVIIEFPDAARDPYA